MAQGTLNKTAPGYKRALLNYYGFTNPNAWPINDGIIHLLGDGSVRGRDHILDIIRNADDPLGLIAAEGEDQIYWAEVITAEHGQTMLFAYREVSDEYAAAFKPWQDGFGGVTLQPEAATAYVRERGPWFEYADDAPIDFSTSGRYYGMFPGIRGFLSAQGWSYYANDIYGHYWNPYHGAIFFTYGPGSTYLVWRPFIVTIDYESGAPQYKAVLWGSKDTGQSILDTSVYPLDETEVQDVAVAANITVAEWELDDITAAYDPDKDTVTITPMDRFQSTRFLQLRIRPGIEGIKLFEGTRRQFYDMSISDGSANVRKVRPGGSSATVGTVPVRTLNLHSPELQAEAGFWGPSYLNYVRPIDLRGTIQPVAMPLNGVDWVDEETIDIPYWTRVVPTGFPFARSELRTCAFVRRDALAVYAGVGVASYGLFTDENDKPDDPRFLYPVFEDAMALRVPADSGTEFLAAVHEAGLCSMPAVPGVSWQAVRPDPEGPPVAWVRFDTTTLRYQALASDDGAFHDPRVNTATTAVEAFLAAGNGLCYEGALGDIPRPRSGVTGTFLGMPIDGSMDFAVDALVLPAGGHMGVLAQAGRIKAWLYDGAAASVIWDAPFAASIPPPLLTGMRGVMPALDLRFMHTSWPTPTGVLTIGDTSFIVAPRDETHVRYAWVVTGVGRVEPPFVMRVGWRAEDRFPNPDPRSPASYALGGP